MRLLLFLAFLVVPVLEIWVLIQVGEVIGGPSTVALLLAGGLLGSWLVRREGRRAWRDLQSALQSGRMPERELADGAMIVAGGTLLLTPGFISDIAGFLLVLPFTRPLMRRLGAWFFTRRIRTLAARAAADPGLGMAFGPTGAAGSPFGPSEAAARGRTGGRGPVIHGEVVRDEPAGPAAPRDSGRDLTAGG
ncbi:FxsA family protein [Planomonospora corallina]|uniref:FxsA family protein n=1 Tax=Planomonospora corallina TaxID=1806052 RepID=A0ABV8IDR5_9ACTN